VTRRIVGSRRLEREHVLVGIGTVAVVVILIVIIAGAAAVYYFTTLPAAKVSSTTTSSSTLATTSTSVPTTSSTTAQTTTPSTTSTQTTTSTNSTVKPNGVDDTADIQAAFNACGTSPGCTVQLVAGTYHISQIAVTGFQGRFVGMGQGVTIIQGLPNLPDPNPAYNQAPSAKYPDGLTSSMAPPGPSNPWPILISFVNGTFAISGMTITDTNDAPIASPGWYDLPATTPSTALASAIFITGTQAHASVGHVTVTGIMSDLGPNMIGGIAYSGILGSPGDTPAELTPLSGTFTMTNSVFTWSGVWIENIVGATVTVCYNKVPASVPYTYGFFDAYNSKLTFCGNSGPGNGGGAAMGIKQDVYHPPPTSGPVASTVYVTDNSFNVSQAANAVILYDHEPTPSLSAVVSGNVFRNNYSSNDWGDSVIASVNLRSINITANTIAAGGAPGIYLNGGTGVVTGNNITGAYTGVWLDEASGVRVANNTITNSVEYGIALTSSNEAGSSATTPSSNDSVTGNVVRNSGTYDIYWDGSGSNDHWCGNVYTSSSPKILPSC